MDCTARARARRVLPRPVAILRQTSTNLGHAGSPGSLATSLATTGARLVARLTAGRPMPYVGKRGLATLATTTCRETPANWLIRRKRSWTISRALRGGPCRGRCAARAALPGGPARPPPECPPGAIVPVAPCPPGLGAGAGGRGHSGLLTATAVNNPECPRLCCPGFAECPRLCLPQCPRLPRPGFPAPR